jgi:hypothetical protein
LAKTAKAFSVPPTLSAVIAARDGEMIKAIQDVVPNK